MEYSLRPYNLGLLQWNGGFMASFLLDYCQNVLGSLQSRKGESECKGFLMVSPIPT